MFKHTVQWFRSRAAFAALLLCALAPTGVAAQLSDAVLHPSPFGVSEW